MAAPLLTVLKYFLLALLWLFFLRVLRAVWTEVRHQNARTPPAPVHAPAASPGPAWPPPPRAESWPDSSLNLSVVEPAEHRGRTFPLSEEVTVGRSPGCGVALPDDSFTSSLHARLWRQDGQVWVEDLGSTNGTYLNRRKLTAPARLSRGDRLQVGHTVMEVGR